jgi:hypothetical protein
VKIFEEIGAKQHIALAHELLESSEKIKKLHQVLEQVRQKHKVVEGE